MNENGQRLLEVYCHHSLSITNTFFMTKPHHKVFWRHPRSKHWYQIDLVLTRCTNLSNVKLTRSYQSADCDTDHSIVCCKVNFKAKRVHHAKKEGRHRINTCITRRPEKVKEFIRVLQEACPAQPSQYKCSSEMGIPHRYHLQCCFTDLWQKTGKDSGLV